MTDGDGGQRSSPAAAPAAQHPPLRPDEDLAARLAEVHRRTEELAARVAGFTAETSRLVESVGVVDPKSSDAVPESPHDPVDDGADRLHHPEGLPVSDESSSSGGRMGRVVGWLSARRPHPDEANGSGAAGTSTGADPSTDADPSTGAAGQTAGAGQSADAAQTVTLPATDSSPAGADSRPRPRPRPAPLPEPDEAPDESPATDSSVAPTSTAHEPAPSRSDDTAPDEPGAHDAAAEHAPDEPAGEDTPTSAQHDAAPSSPSSPSEQSHEGSASAGESGHRSPIAGAAGPAAAIAAASAAGAAAATNSTDTNSTDTNSTDPNSTDANTTSAGSAPTEDGRRPRPRPSAAAPFVYDTPAATDGADDGAAPADIAATDRSAASAAAAGAGTTADKDAKAVKKTQQAEAKGAAKKDDSSGTSKKRSFSIGGYLRRIRKLVIVLVVLVAAVLALRQFVVAPYYVPSASMEPTLHGCPNCNDDHVLAEKLSYDFHDPRRGDIVVFDNPGGAWKQTGDAVLIKRVIGVPGDHIVVKNGKVLINGLRQSETYLNPKCGARATRTESGKVDGVLAGRVPAGKLFVMGDNRCNSADSRFFGAIPIDKVVGKALLIFYPFGRIGSP